MGKTLVSIKYLAIIGFLFIATSTKSQESFTKELKWVYGDSLVKPILYDTLQIIEWGINIDAPQLSYETQKFYVKDKNVFILMVDICSGIYCPFISVFKKDEENWCLITTTHAILPEKLEVFVDNRCEKIIFKTKSGQIGKLPFDVFLE